MPVVWKLDGELPLVLWLRGLLGIVRFAESETRGGAWGRSQVTDGADCGTRATHRLGRKELRTMTTNAGIVIGEVSDIRKIALRIPDGRNLMTGIAGEAFMFVGRMKKGRIFYGWCDWCLLSCSTARGPAASLGRRSVA